MSKVLWHTVKLEVPKEMVNITKDNKVVIKKTLTKTNNISKSNKEPSIKIVAGNVNKPKIISNGKEWNIEELKISMKKSKDLSNKNKDKEFKKKPKENEILKPYVKKVKEVIKELRGDTIIPTNKEGFKKYTTEQINILTRYALKIITGEDHFNNIYNKYTDDKYTHDQKINIIMKAYRGKKVGTVEKPNPLLGVVNKSRKNGRIIKK